MRKGSYAAAIYAAAFLWTVGALSPGEAFASQALGACDQPPTVTVEPVFDKPQYHNDADLAAIKRLFNSEENVIPQYDAVTLGFTRYRPTLSVQAPVLMKRFRDGSRCTQLTGVTIRHGYTNVVIEVAKNFPKGSCAYEHILAHEMKHVAENEALVREFSYTIKSRVDSFVRLHAAKYNDDAAMTQHELEQRISSIARETLSQINQENDRRQRLVDSPQEYARNTTACGGAIQREAKAFQDSQTSWWPF